MDKIRFKKKNVGFFYHLAAAAIKIIIREDSPKNTKHMSSFMQAAGLRSID